MKIKEILIYFKMNGMYSYKDVMHYLNTNYKYEFVGKTLKSFVKINDKMHMLFIRSGEYHGDWKLCDMNKIYLNYDLNDYIKHLFRYYNKNYKDKHFASNNRTYKVNRYFDFYLENKKYKYRKLLNELYSKDIEIYKKYKDFIK